jgi:hypothetical protein
MFNFLLKRLVDFIYGTNRAKKKYQLKNPNEKILACDASKGIITNKNEHIEKGTKWVTSQRAIIILTEHKIVCGKWEIPIDTIKKIELFKIKSLIADGMVLKIQTLEDKHYQFGMQMNDEWLNQKTISLTLEETKVKYSKYSIIVRIIAVGYISYIIYTRFFQN